MRLRDWDKLNQFFAKLSGQHLRLSVFSPACSQDFEDKLLLLFLRLAVCSALRLFWDAERHLKDYTGAISDFNKTIELNPKDALPYAGLGFVQNDRFQFESALKNFQKALQLDPSQDEWRFRIWLIQSRLNDWFGETEEQKKYAVSLKGKKITWSAEIGLFLVGSVYEKNFLNCAKSSDQKTQNWWQCQANYYVGMEHLIAGDKVGAMDFFQQCLNTKETSLTVYNSAEAEFNALKKIIPP